MRTKKYDWTARFEQKQSNGKHTIINIVRIKTDQCMYDITLAFTDRMLFIMQKWIKVNKSITVQAPCGRC